MGLEVRTRVARCGPLDASQAARPFFILTRTRTESSTHPREFATFGWSDYSNNEIATRPLECQRGLFSEFDDEI